MARYLVPPLFAFAAVALAVQAASSSEIVTAASPTGHVFVEDNNPLQLEIIKTCDGGHGVCMSHSSIPHVSTAYFNHSHMHNRRLLLR
jgi:hypothetical protein